MTGGSKTESAGRVVALGDAYLAFLCWALLGYAVMGRGFAYLGLPPLYAGEIALFAGLVVFVRSGALVASLATLPIVVLVVLMAWVLVRTIPFVSEYGFDALRDSTVIVYGLFALIVIGLVLEDARRIDTVLRYYNILLMSVPAIFVGFCLTQYFSEYVPTLFGPAPIVELTTSAVATHLCGAMVFVLIGYRKVSLRWFLIWLATFAIVAATNRGGTLAVLVPVVFAMIMLGRFRLLRTTMLTVVGVFALLLAVETTFVQNDETSRSTKRILSAHQIVKNAESILGDSGQLSVEGTKRWRLDWWDIIIKDTVYGPNFWMGRGFGLNLAEADGHAGGEIVNGQPRAPTRSPHNVNMTMLARAGVPGVVLWSILLTAWGGMMLHAMLGAYGRGHKQWADLFLFVICYETSIIINAFVDVTIEGPMQGIWFWCLFGFGVGSVMVYRARATAGSRMQRP